jgi:HK97 family phage prohead protease
MGALVVDRLTRTIAGLAVPYGPVGHTRGRRWRFEPGALEYADPVWLLVDHDHGQRLGRATGWHESAAGLWAVLRVRTGRRGDRALALAATGELRGLSAGIERAELGRDQGVTVVRRALLREVSLTAAPAFEGGEEG